MEFKAELLLAALARLRVGTKRKTIVLNKTSTTALSPERTWLRYMDVPSRE